MSGKSLITLLGKGFNNGTWNPLVEFFDQRKLTYEMHHTHESVKKECALGILLGYSRVVPASVLDKAQVGFVVFHSSDLPQGRGFAPIYNTISRNMPLTQTLCFAAVEVDCGNVIAKARYKLHGDELEDEVRLIDDHLTMFLIEDALNPLLSGQVEGVPQEHDKASWWSQRTPDESGIDPKTQIAKYFDHLRALPTTAPAFFEYRGRKYFLRLEASNPIRPFDPTIVMLERYYDH